MNGDKNTSNLVQTILLLATILFLVIKSFVFPNTSSASAADLAKLSETVNVNSQRIARLEELASLLRDMPADMSSAKAILDRVEKKLDDHMRDGR